ncbi:hypothetical protein ACHAXR_007381 [Thalassiosira sp. AJA248-18]
MDALNRRESEREDWWRPRAEGVADYISKKFSTSDIILLQEWWFDEKFTTVFDAAMGDSFERIAERRPSGEEGKMRDDGMCCLVNKKGKLELIKSEKVLTGPQRIGQIIQCRERCSAGEGRNVFIANSHLSFPGDQDPVKNDQKQANEASIILEGLTKASTDWETSYPGNEFLEVVCGDFNSNSCGLAASLVESLNFVNCASATAEQMLTNVGGQVNIGVTHCDHLGQHVSVDQIFLRLAKKDEKKRSRYVNLNSAEQTQTKQDRCAALALGYLDEKGTRILNVRLGNIQLEGRTVLSDHRPVTAKIAWPRIATSNKKEILSDLYMNCTLPLDPLEPAWGIVEPGPWGVLE